MPRGTAFFHTNGEKSGLDTSFGGDGSVQGEVFSSPALVLQPDGKLLTAGTTFVHNNGVLQPNFSLQRFNPDGSPDASFGTGGLVLLDGGEANAVVLQPDGRLVVAGAIGRFDVKNPPDRVLARFHSDGSLDTTFGNGGVVVTDGGDGFGGFDGWDALVLQGDGRLIATDECRVARHNTDGSLDTSFGSGGVAAFVGSACSGIALQDGKLVAGGFSCFSLKDCDFALERRLTTNERPKRPPKCGGRRATILGTSGDDTLRGTVFQDVILGRGGNDTIRGLAGNDTICGGPGRDILIGGDGEDRLLGEVGDDKLFGDRGSDKLDGGSGSDACRTGETAQGCEGKPASSKPTSGERPKDPPKVPCPPVSNFPCN